MPGKGLPWLPLPRILARAVRKAGGIAENA